MRMKEGISIVGVLICMSLLLQQAMAIDVTQIQFREAMETASAEGIPALIGKLDALVKAAPASASSPDIQETIQAIGLLHPGSVPDRVERLGKLKASASGDPLLARTLKRIEILQSYYSAAVQGNPESASNALSDPVFEGSPYGIQAMADAALRAHNYEKSAALAMQVIELDPYSPLLSNAYMILGLSSAFRGDSRAALIHFHHALATSELPTIYGLPRDYVFTTHRFSRAVPAPIGEIFDELQTTQLTGGAEVRDPQALIFNDAKYTLLDKAVILTISQEGKILDRKPAREIEDIATTRDGKFYSITNERIDLGAGSSATLSLTAGNKTKRITKLRSLAADNRDGVYFLDQDQGILRGTTAVTAGAISLSDFAPVKGRLIRSDSWGNFYVLSTDQKSIVILSREGKQLGSITPDPVGGKIGTIEYFALDSLNHIYILESGSIQIFAIFPDSAGFKNKRISMYALDQRPQFRNLRVLAVNATGELVMTGKNDGAWVCFK